MICVLTGGHSSERQVSLNTAKTVESSLDNLGIEFQVIDIADKDWLEIVKSNEPSVCILAVHGTFAEDGELQKILEQNDISFTGSSSDVAKKAFNKRESKNLAATLGITVPKEFSIDSIPTGVFPLVVKPNQEGSSFGVSIVNDSNELNMAIKAALAFDQTVLIEEYVDGREFSCGVIDVFGKVEALPVIEIEPSSQFFDYSSKYTEGLAVETCPANIGTELAEVIRSLSLKVYKNLGLRQYGRVDWIARNDQPYFLEINTLPGLTHTSLINKELSAAGISFDKFIEELIETAC